MKQIRGECSVAVAKDDLNVLIVSQSGTSHGWISDSDYFFHICSGREMFIEGSLRLMHETVHLEDCKEYAITEV